jgi:hypothetical protein
MRSPRQPDTWIILSDPSKGRERTDAPATRGDETLSEFTSETHASSDVKASVTEAAGSTGLKIASRHLPNFTAHEHTATPSPARFHAFARRELIESLSAQVRNLRARARVPDVPMWIGRVRNIRLRNIRLFPANAALTFAGGIATGALIMWFATAQPSTTVPTATPSPAQDLPLSAMKRPASSLDTAQEVVRARSTSQPPAIVSAVATSGRRSDVVAQRARPSRAKSAPAVTRKNAASTPLATRRNTPPGSYRGSLVLRSAPQGARVFVNGALVGSTPLVLENLPVGSRAVRIEADGYQHWSTSTQVVANQETHLSATLAHAAP